MSIQADASRVFLVESTAARAGEADMNYQVMPDLSPQDYEALKNDIAQRGVLIPVEYDEHGNVLDGYHRLRACKELGLSAWPKFIRKGLSEEEKREHARQLNIARRHLNQEQKRQLIKDQLKDTPHRSNRQIASGLGVDHKTVSAARSDLEGTGEIPQLEKTVGTDGKARPARPIRTIFAVPGVPDIAGDQKDAETPVCSLPAVGFRVFVRQKALCQDDVGKPDIIRGQWRFGAVL
jgi:hypothetical protein